MMSPRVAVSVSVTVQGPSWYRRRATQVQTLDPSIQLSTTHTHYGLVEERVFIFTEVYS